MKRYALPERKEPLLAALASVFQSEGKQSELKVVVNSRVDIDEGADYDNWNGGTHGHVVHFFLPPQLAHLAVGDGDALGYTICALLNKLARVEGEHFSRVTTQLDPQPASPSWRQDSGALAHTPTLSNASNSDLTRLWKDYPLRAFLSHRADFKVEANSLRKSLERLQIGAFVAHEDIEPTRAWQGEIERALGSMHVLVTLNSSGFRDSHWTNQEIGVALGRGVPIVSLRLDEDPVGFVGHIQAVNGRAKEPTQWAPELFGAFAKLPAFAANIRQSTLLRWENSKSFIESMEVFDLMKKLGQLTSPELERVEAAFEANNQLSGCYVVGKDYPDFLTNQQRGLGRPRK